MLSRFGDDIDDTRHPAPGDRLGKAIGGHVAAAPDLRIGAGNETRTRDHYLGKVVLYQLSYARIRRGDTIKSVGPVCQLPNGRSAANQPGRGEAGGAQAIPRRLRLLPA